MKRSLIFISFSLVLLTFVSCSSGNKVTSDSSKVHPHTALRKLEIDMIKVGDSLVKTEAVLGKPTEKSSDPAGTVQVWWLAEDKNVPEQYYTLKEKPEETDGKFIKLIFDAKNKITSKDFKL
ncbi:LIC13410 family lipoprotein [Leptospira sp. 'Mane']|uniref:LIC13410 family lipoprotein n=1 Tax=Leptospira sp. 'Mane' TaxID=3387407 RepID=UPI00398A9105